MLHYIIVKWKDTVDKQEVSQKVRKLYAGAVEIPGVYNVIVKEKVTPRPNRYDLMIVLDMVKMRLWPGITVNFTKNGKQNTAVG